MTAFRKNRHASDDAHAWARKLRLGNPLAKLLLCMLTIYVNGDGECYASVNQLADDCEFDRKTVMTRLAWLEERGFISRQRQWMDAKGNRNIEGVGRQTSDLITLLMSGEENSTYETIPSIGPRQGPQRSTPRTTNDALRSVSGPLAVPLGGPPKSSEPEPEEEKEETPARAPLISEQAFAVAAECLQVLHVDPKDTPPEWCGLPYQIQILLTRGCDRMSIVATFARLSGRNPRPSMSYFAKAVETEQSKPKTPIVRSKTDAGKAADNRATTWQGSRDRWRQAAAELNASVAADQANEGAGGEDVRPAAAARRD